ncbi:MAG TPA: heat-inducible transcriptional repressor HrcA [Balneolales bacterium]|nr:heat-inducible transcriptional repressor HrcA [Balneolales bacterium]
MDLNDSDHLEHREREILEYVIRNFIITANPIASRKLVEKHHLNISSATVRNVMNSLEKKGYLDHQHTSSGRIPTEKGYRLYVNSLMRISQLSKSDWAALQAWEQTLTPNLNEAVQGATRMLSRLTNLLVVVLTPQFANAILKKIELIDLSSTRLLIVLTIESGLAKTVTMEVESGLHPDELDNIARVLNERLSGLSLSEITKHIDEALADAREKDKTGLIRIFIDSADDLFEDKQFRRFHFGGVEYIAMQPEFNDLNNLKSIIEFVEDDDLIIHLFDGAARSNEVNVRIGKENKIQQIEHCSVVSANYAIGNVTGTIGLVGPTRMNYPRLINLIDQFANRFQSHTTS